MVFIVFFLLLMALRIAELILSKHHEKWLLKNGAIEFGKAHYPWMIALHVSFFISLLVEYYFQLAHSCNFYLLFCFLVLTALKVWVINSLEKYWTTKIYRIPNTDLVKKGVYKYFKHPNYAIVVFEIAIIPLMFHLYFTAIIFSILNAMMLYVRISEENKILQQQ